MKMLTYAALASVVISSVCSAALAQGPKTTYVIPPADINATPAAFRKADTVSFTASFVAPQKCQDAGMQIRLYNVDENSAEPTWQTPFLISLASAYDFISAAGSKTQTVFETAKVPANAGPNVYAVVWTSCTVRIPKGIDPTTGMIIWDVETAGFNMGGVVFKFDCTGAGRTTSLCAYRKG